MFTPGHYRKQEILNKLYYDVKKTNEKKWEKNHCQKFRHPKEKS